MCVGSWWGYVFKWDGFFETGKTLCSTPHPPFTPPVPTSSPLLRRPLLHHQLPATPAPPPPQATITPLSPGLCAPRRQIFASEISVFKVRQNDMPKEAYPGETKIK